MPQARLKCPAEGEALYAWVDDTHEIVLFRLRSVVHACNAICPHMGARLEVDFRTGTLRCPWHGLTAEVPGFATGHHRFRRVREYAVAVKGDDAEITY